MACLVPPPLSDDALSAVLDGSASPAMEAHLAQCPSCRARVQQAARLEMRLHNLYRWECPSADELSDYQLGYSAPTTARRIAQHLDRCLRCQTEQAELRTFLAPEAAPTAAVNPWRMRPANDAAQTLLLPAGLPSVGLSQADRPSALRGRAGELVIVTAPGLTLIIEATAKGDGTLDLVGQLAADDQTAWEGACVELWQAGMLQATAWVDGYGSWQCSPALPSSADVRLIPVEGPSLLLVDLDLSQS